MEDEADDELSLSPSAPLQEVDLSRPSDTSVPGQQHEERGPSQVHSTRFASAVQEHPNPGYDDEEDDLGYPPAHEPPQFTNKDSGFSPVQRPGFSRASSFASEAESDREGDDDVLYDWVSPTARARLS